MTRKDYIKLAAAMKEAMQETARSPRAIAWNDAVTYAAGRVADALASDNPRFDRARFLTACGVED